MNDPLGSAGAQQRRHLVALHPEAQWADMDAEQQVDERDCGVRSLVALHIGRCLLRHMRTHVARGDRHRRDVPSAGRVAAACALRLRSQRRRSGWLAVFRHLPQLLTGHPLAVRGRQRRRQPGLVLIGQRHFKRQVLCRNGAAAAVAPAPFSGALRTFRRW